MEVYEEHDGGVTQRKLSRTHAISPTTVERWYQNHVERRLSEMFNRPCPQVLGRSEAQLEGYLTKQLRALYTVKLDIEFVQ